MAPYNSISYEAGSICQKIESLQADTLTLFSTFQNQVLEALSKHGIKYIIVGGVATIFHGVMRSTGDLDILVQATTNNGEKILSAFKELSLETEDITKSDFEGELFLSFGFEPDAIDLMTFTPGINFETAYSRAEKIKGSDIRVVSLEDLITNKESLHREGSKEHLDKFDIEELKKIRRAK